MIFFKNGRHDLSSHHNRLLYVTASIPFIHDRLLYVELKRAMVDPGPSLNIIPFIYLRDNWIVSG